MQAPETGATISGNLWARRNESLGRLLRHVFVSLALRSGLDLVVLWVLLRRWPG